MEEGFAVLAVERLEEGLRLLLSGRFSFHLLIWDLMGSSVTPETLALLRSAAGDIPVLILSGPFQQAGLDFKASGFPHILIRPFTVQDVIATAKALLHHK